MLGKLIGKTLQNELKRIAIYSVCLDAAAFIISLIFYRGFSISFAAGLFLGTLALLLNMLILGISIRDIPGSVPKMAKRKAIAGYILRLTVIGALLVLSSKTGFINTIAAMIPVFYPRIIYWIDLMLFKNGGGIE